MKIVKPLEFGENAVVEIQRDLNNGALIHIREGGQKPRFIRLSRENSIGVALSLLIAAGMPIEEIHRRQQALKANG